MKSEIGFFAFLIVMICAFLSLQYCVKESQNKMPPVTESKNEMPSGVVISGDSAYYPDAFSRINISEQNSLDSVGCFPSYDSEPKILKQGEALYPKDEVKDKREGDTKVKLWIDEKGIPRLALIIASSDSVFNEQSLIVAMNTVFTPAIMRKKTVGSWAIMPCKFRLQ